MFAKNRERMTDGEFCRFLPEPMPGEPVAAPLPRMKLRLDYLRHNGGAMIIQDLPSLVVRHGTGVFRQDELPLDDPLLTSAPPFRAEDVKKLLMPPEGSDGFDGWLLYGFEVMAYSVTLLYYQEKDPDLRGALELGRNFSSLQLTIESHEHSYSIYLGRNQQTMWAPLKRWRHPYMDCQAVVAQRDKDDSHTTQTHNLSGTDTCYID